MADVVDIPGTEELLSQPVTRVLAATRSAMEANKMANAVEIHTPAQIAAVEPVRRAITPMEMVARAVDNNASIETLTKLMDLQERYEANEARKAFEDAMAHAKAEIPEIRKSSKVDFTTKSGRTNYQYEDLAAIMSVISPILSKYGLRISYRTSSEPNSPITVTCVVSHALGHHEENTLMAGRDDSGNKNTIQAIGSTVTYLQRYTLKAALGLAAAADDDGAKADEKHDDVNNRTTQPKYITEVQANVIYDLIEEAQVSTDKLCERFGIGSVKEMPMHDFNEVVGALRRRIAMIKEKKGSAA